MNISLSGERVRLTSPLDLGDRFTRACFTKEPRRPEFTLDVNWVDVDWPRIIHAEWQDTDGSPGQYYVRVEQIDGNIAWSSPIWFLDQPVLSGNH